MPKIFSDYGPHILGTISLLFSAGFFKFVIDILKIHGRNKARKEAQERVYEVAYRLSLNYSKILAQLAIVVSEAFRNEDEKMLPGCLQFMSNFLGEEDHLGAWHDYPFPDFMRMAHDEIEAAFLKSYGMGEQDEDEKDAKK